MKSFAVITPTTGAPELAACVKSLQGQDCIHYIVMDGRENFAKINKVLLSVGLTQKQRLITLDGNVGKGWYGHRVYAAASFLVNEDVLCYMDEDNYADPQYIDSFRETLNKGYQWAYTLRNIVEQNGTFVCPDNFESLGHWPVLGQNRYHIDTGCFAVPREIAVRIGHNWYGQWGADRQFFAAIKQAYPRFGCTMRHTLFYRLGGETNRVQRDFFLNGSKMSEQYYKGEYPWLLHSEPRNARTEILTFNTQTNQFSR